MLHCILQKINFALLIFLGANLLDKMLNRENLIVDEIFVVIYFFLIVKILNIKMDIILKIRNIKNTF